MRFLAKHEVYVWWRRLVKTGRWRVGVRERMYNKYDFQVVDKKREMEKRRKKKGRREKTEFFPPLQLALIRISQALTRRRFTGEG